ncbi:PilZ domain-containing protein [Anaeromyxobacter paludicola]|uniref:PilZ domain-containing protein n=1 Tax=Anaeromyxobacter paludicola TaxID=2918171 RepID=UPI0020C08A4F|nr:PilZ domain-containing protein [Anaeromyxobacter paludicola]
MLLRFPSPHTFEERNRALLDDPRALPPADLLLWRQGRDELARRALEGQQEASRRRTPRVDAVYPAFLAGYGGVFTVDLGFEGVSLRVCAGTRLRRAEPASVRLKVGNQSIYLSGRVAWGSDDRVGLQVEQVHPADEQVLQAAVCKRLLEVLQPGSGGRALMGRRAGD